MNIELLSELRTVLRFGPGYRYVTNIIVFVMFLQQLNTILNAG